MKQLEWRAVKTYGSTISSIISSTISSTISSINKTLSTTSVWIVSIWLLKLKRGEIFLRQRCHVKKALLHFFSQNVKLSSLVSFFLKYIKHFRTEKKESRTITFNLSSTRCSCWTVTDESGDSVPSWHHTHVVASLRHQNVFFHLVAHRVERQPIIHQCVTVPLGT